MNKREIAEWSIVIGFFIMAIASAMQALEFHHETTGEFNPKR